MVVVGVGEADVAQELDRLLIALSDQIGRDRAHLEHVEPKGGDALGAFGLFGGGGLLGAFLELLFFLIVALVGRLFVGGLGIAVHKISTLEKEKVSGK